MEGWNKEPKIPEVRRGRERTAFSKSIHDAIDEFIASGDDCWSQERTQLTKSERRIAYSISRKIDKPVSIRLRGNTIYLVRTDR